MNPFQARAFVLRSVRYGENRRILELLTEDGSILTASASVSKSALSPALAEAFMFAEYQIFKNKERFRIDGGQIIYPFSDLREDVERLCCASHLAELWLDCLRDEFKRPESFRLLAYSLRRLEETENPLLDVQAVQFRFLSELGFRPWLQDCLYCHESLGESGRFIFAAGGLCCEAPACLKRAGEGRVQFVSEGLRHCLLHLSHCELNRLFSWSLSDERRQELIQFSSAWLEQVMEKDYSRLRFMEELRNFRLAKNP